MSTSKSTKSLDKKATNVVRNILDIPDVPYEHRLAKLTQEQKQHLQDIEDRVISTPGNIDEIEAAIGMLRVGHHFGWKVLYIVHSKRTVRKYEEILGIKIREFFPAEGPSAPRSIGLNLANKMTNFWKVVSGEIKITNRKEIN
jgi:hypothetical protein